MWLQRTWTGRRSCNGELNIPCLACLHVEDDDAVLLADLLRNTIYIPRQCVHHNAVDTVKCHRGLFGSVCTAHSNYN